MRLYDGSPLTSLRTFLKALLATLGLALAVPMAGSAHIVPQPAFIAQGAETTISLDVPNERAPHTTTGVEVTAPRGFTVVSVEQTPGWTATTNGRTVTWTGGRLTGVSTARFGVGLLTDVAPGPVTLDAVQRYDDAQSVTWKIPFSVVPGAEPASSGPDRGRIALGAFVAACVVAGTLGMLLRSRRRKSG
jgi:uncharacterized protein YcnI